MSKILLQTTIPYIEDDWHVGRFSMLADLLRKAGHEVVCRDREVSGAADPVLSDLENTEFDQLWLIAVDTGNGLAPQDVRAILRFRERGGGIVTARDHQDVGASLLNLGALGLLNNFNRYNRERDRRRLVPDDRDNPLITFPNYHSGNNGDYQRIVAMQPVHELLRSERSPSGVVEYFPAHPHEGALSVPPGMPYAHVIATSLSTSSGRAFNLAIVIEDEPGSDGHPCGRAVALSTFHQLADMNWDRQISPPSFVTEPSGEEMAQDPERMEIYKDYIRNLARWLGARSYRRSSIIDWA